MGNRESHNRVSRERRLDQLFNTLIILLCAILSSKLHNRSGSDKLKKPTADVESDGRQVPDLTAGKHKGMRCTQRA